MSEEKDKLLKIGIIGVGFVGGAIYNFFSSKEVDIAAFDIKGNFNISDVEIMSDSFDKVLDSDYLFICLPTPYVEGFGFDYSAIHSTMLEITKMNYKGTIILKSTVEPGTTRAFAKQYNLKNIVFNPEFLTARSANQDFIDQKQIIIGGLDQETCLAVAGLYQKFFNANITVCLAEEAECMKIFSNVFYSTKVQVFNEFALLCKRLGLNYDSVKNLMLCRNWINPMHTEVPGPDGKYSYGGACFVKDTKALRDFMDRNHVPNGVIEAVIKERDIMRDD